jgi:hypothetical protein
MSDAVKAACAGTATVPVGLAPVRGCEEVPWLENQCREGAGGQSSRWLWGRRPWGGSDGVGRAAGRAGPRRRAGEAGAGGQPLGVAGWGAAAGGAGGAPPLSALELGGEGAVALRQGVGGARWPAGSGWEVGEGARWPASADQLKGEQGAPASGKASGTPATKTLQHAGSGGKAERRPWGKGSTPAGGYGCGLR